MAGAKKGAEKALDAEVKAGREGDKGRTHPFADMLNAVFRSGQPSGGNLFDSSQMAEIVTRSPRPTTDGPSRPT